MLNVRYKIFHLNFTKPVLSPHEIFRGIYEVNDKEIQFIFLKKFVVTLVGVLKKRCTEDVGKILRKTSVKCNLKNGSMS